MTPLHYQIIIAILAVVAIGLPIIIYMRGLYFLELLHPEHFWSKHLKIISLANSRSTDPLKKELLSFQIRKMYKEDLDKSENFYTFVKTVKSIMDSKNSAVFSDVNLQILISEIKNSEKLPKLLNEFLQHDFILFQTVLKMLSLNTWATLFPEKLGADVIAHELHIIIDKEIDKTDSLIVVKSLESLMTYGYLQENIVKPTVDERVVFRTKLRDKIEAKKEKLQREKVIA